DDGNIKGVKSEEEEKYMILTAAHQFCKPAIEPFFEEIYVDDKLVLIVNIPESDLKPHYALDDQNKWWAYIRIDDKTVLASKIIVEVLKNDHKDQGVLISYSDNEKVLLQYLADHERITLKEFSKLLRCSYRKAQKILVNLILTNVIKAYTSEKEEYFVAV
ncbi:MAG: ATP-binding protein, partial [Pedobacter sp.]